MQKGVATQRAIHISLLHYIVMLAYHELRASVPVPDLQVLDILLSTC